MQSLSVTDLQKQYQKLVNAQQMLILGAGDAQESQLKDFSSTIEKVRNGPSQLDKIVDAKPVPKLRVVLFDKPDRTQTQVLIGQLGVVYADPRLDALQIANYAFGGGGFQSRLMIELRVKRGAMDGAGCGFKLASHPHTWNLSFFPKNSDTPPAVREALKMVRELHDHGLSQEEFGSSKRSMINSAGFGFNTPQKRLENRMTEVLYGLPEGYFRNFASRISKISLEEVNQAIRGFVTPDKMMVGIVATASLSKAAIAKELGVNEKDIEVQDYQKE